MQRISDLLARDLNHKIEEVIKVDQTDEQSVYTEITEYVVTDRIREQYREVFRAIADAPAEPHEGIGIWISGFFGSGKSSFAKNLGYVLANQGVLGYSASQLFKAKVADTQVESFIDFINAKIPSEVIMFDISKASEVRLGDEKIADVVYRALLSKLDYALDYDIAELEIDLESKGELDEFIALCPSINGLEWNMARKGARKLNHASAILHHMNPAVFPHADSWAKSLGSRNTVITVHTVVERAFELTARRRPGKALVIIIDEVGQYVARSAEKIEDLRALVEEFGKVGKNLVNAKKAIAPAWVVVTSQEKLDEVVAAIDSKRVELAKLQDRFKYRIDMAPADIHEVATKRVLAKKDSAIPALTELFDKSQGQLNAAVKLERTSRKSSVVEKDFVQFYPYLPHYVELSIDILSGIRLQPGAPKHYGGSNRTVIKQAYEMLVSDRTSLATKPVGRLVTVDNIFELVEGNLSTEKQKDISDITQRFKDDPQDQGMAARVAKALAVLEFVRDLPRTESNIAACLVSEVGQYSPLAEVQRAIKLLDDSQFIRNTEEGWKLQTAQEKGWDNERRGYLEPKPKDRNEIIRGTITDIFEEPELKTYRFRNLRNFRVGISINGIQTGDQGQIPLAIIATEDAEDYRAKLSETRDESRRNENTIYWVFFLNAEIDDLVAGLYASKQMVSKYDQLRAQNNITNEEASLLQAEKNEVLRIQGRLRDKMLDALQGGTGMFRGVSKDGSVLGKTTSEMFRNLFDFAVPDLYPKLEMGARPIKGTEADEILKAANLSGLSNVFYGGESGLNLVVKEGSKFVPNLSADIVKEVLDYLTNEHQYGNRDTRTGKSLETHFSGLGYGWDRDTLRLILSVLFRGGAIDVTYGGQRFDSYLDPRSREPFTSNTTFKSALFTPTTVIDLKTLTSAVKTYEELTGDTVDVEKNAIAAAFKQLASDELDALKDLEAVIKANHLPVAETIEDYKNTLATVVDGTADYCVRTLAGEGQSLRDAREKVRKIREAADEQGLKIIQHAHVAADQMWPVLSERGKDGHVAPDAEELKNLLGSATFYDSIMDIKLKTNTVASAYKEAYKEVHTKRGESFASAIDDVKGRSEWLNVPDEMKDPVLSSLTSRACQYLDLHDDSAVCSSCGATLNQMDSDLAAVGGLKGQVLARVQEITAPKQKVERIHLYNFFTDSLDSEEAVESAVERLKEHLLKLLAEGVKIVLE